MASPLAHLLDPVPPPRPLHLHTPAISSIATTSSASSLAPPPLPAPARIQVNPLQAPPPPVAPTTPGTPPRSHANNTSLYQCADCLKRYSRPEHLQRHIATHTLGKRFVCDVCGKAFGRADLLKRHRANHDENDNGTKRRRINSSPGAGRVAHACQACARARVKCEEMKPCSRCRTRNIICEYASSEAGSAAAMHLLHLSANAHTHSRQGSESSAAPSRHTQESSPQSTYQNGSAQGLHPPVAATTGIGGGLGDHPSMAGNAPMKPVHAEQAQQHQLPTPDTMDQNNSDGFQQPYPPDSSNMAAVMDPRLPFSDFLRGVVQPAADPARLAEAQGLAVLDFCDDTNLELNDIDFGLLDHWNVDGIIGGNVAEEPEFAARVEESADMAKMRQRLVKVWTESPWCFNPNRHDSGYREQGNLPVPSSEAEVVRFQQHRQRLDRVVQDKLESSGRDKILAIVLSTCQKDNLMMTRVASSFPSVDIVDSLIHLFLASHLCQVSEWIHYGSFSLNAQWPEWLACAASAGAILTPNPTLRKFGYALQEAVRVTIPARFEDKNISIQDIGLVQALVLGQDVGLWSGNRRKMEIAECHLNIPITMIRYRGKFQRSFYPAISLNPSEQGAEVEQKWLKWRERESWKRLVFHCYLRDAQMSITTLTPPHISYSELTLPLPESRELWFARTAQEWQMHYIEKAARETKRPPSLADLLRDIDLLSANHHRLDVQLAISIYLHGFWSLIWEYRQLHAIHRSSVSSPPLSEQNPNMLLNIRRQELVKQLSSFQLVTSDWHELSAQESLVLNLLQMNLHVSLDDLQLFSGKEGEDQARRIYPTLQRWANNAEARQALWHAGQILGLAKMFPPGHLKDFYAIAVHHAALALWAWGVVRKTMRRQSMGSSEFVFFDGPFSPHVQRYIEFEQGAAAIRGLGTKEGSPTTTAFLEDPRACMDVAQDILRANFIEDSLPPIVENLCHLIKQLGNAAWAVGLG